MSNNKSFIFILCYCNINITSKISESVLDVYITTNYWSIRVETTENDVIRYGRPSGKTYNEKFEDTKGVIRTRKSKDRQYNGQKKKE